MAQMAFANAGSALWEALSSDAEDQVCLRLANLADGPYFILAQWLDAGTLCSTDATCRRLLALNSAHIGPWRALGARLFRGLELQDEGLFEPDEGKDQEGKKLLRIHWKGRYQRFRSLLSTFAAPFNGSEITRVEDPDEVAYFQCNLRTDVIADSSAGIYLEVEVLQNPDNLSMAVVDFEAGGCSSLTFSPDTGAVIQERKLVESPRKVEGAYIQPLPMLLSGERFLGFLGLYLRGSHVAFFRKAYVSVPGRHGIEKTTGPWETTGFISNLAWASEQQLTPCLAFRNEGTYQVRITRISGQPPIIPDALKSPPPSDLRWSGLEWEADMAHLANA